ncbi:hypothetical protein L596_010594 [Steinernema carpocapsae]|uniref:MARVEL domain-containing protein n=1 Tax=Steinernema carpocapsae TaxID=34508 RepID=A0A4V6A6X7_STECR|nr:hypothetical protein L596_010594 [Steinernema carpocapsae]
MATQSSAKLEAPEDVVFDPNHESYMAPAVCRILHYRHGAILAGFVEVGLMAMAVATILSWYIDDGITNTAFTALTVFILIGACMTTVIMVVGVVREKPSYFNPQIVFLQFEIAILLLGAAVSIASMSLGINATHYLFGFFVSVHQMEDFFGPIWPFNVALLSFSGAAAGLWSHILVKGCQDYYLDKEYFEALESNKIEMKKPM